MSQGIKMMLALCSSPDGLKQLMQLQPSADDFKGEAERTVFDFVTVHVNKHGSLPLWQTVLDAADKQDWDFSLPGDGEALEPASFYFEKVRERTVHVALKGAMQEATKFLNASNPVEAFSLMQETMQQLQLHTNRSKLINYSEEGLTIIQRHLLSVANGAENSLKLGYKYLDGMSGGLVGGDVLSIIGRPAQGKTFLLLWMAQYGWMEQDQRPLVLSMEMKASVIIQRLAAMQAKIALTHIKMGTLAKESQAKPLIKTLKGNKTRPPFWIIDGALATNVSQLKTYARQLKPTSVWVDGAYLMRHENAKLNRYERVTDNAERLKGEIAEALDIPVTISYQFNRDSTKQKAGVTAGLEHIAYTDAIGQLSSLVLAMQQEESVETIFRRKVQVLKGRSGEVGGFDINWRFQHPDAMNFSQYTAPEISELIYI